jgi:hypothetical protein
VGAIWGFSYQAQINTGFGHRDSEDEEGKSDQEEQEGQEKEQEQ